MVNFVLSPRELQALELQRGRPNATLREIGRAMGITHSTVGKLLAKARQKTRAVESLDEETVLLLAHIHNSAIRAFNILRSEGRSTEKIAEWDSHDWSPRNVRGLHRRGALRAQELAWYLVNTREEERERMLRFLRLQEMPG